MEFAFVAALLWIFLVIIPYLVILFFVSRRANVDAWIQNAEKVLGEDFLEPNRTKSAFGDEVLEWWVEDRKLTVFFEPHWGRIDYLKVWGPDIFDDMTAGPLKNDKVLKNLWNWLLYNTPEPSGGIMNSINPMKWRKPWFNVALDFLQYLVWSYALWKWPPPGGKIVWLVGLTVVWACLMWRHFGQNKK